MGEEDDIITIVGDSITIDTAIADYDVWLQDYAANIQQDNFYDYAVGDIHIGDYTATTAANNIILNGGGEEMLRVAEDGFYVRGVKVKQGKREAKVVYEAFKKWMTWAIINGDN